MQQQSDICIVGYGAVGKVAALGLAQAGHSVILVRPATVPVLAAPEVVAGWDVRVYALNHEAQALLASVKVWDAMDAARIAPVAAMAVQGDATTGAGHLGFDAYGARVGALAWIVEDANLNQALDAALKFSPNVRIVAANAKGLRITEQTAILKLENSDEIHSSLLIGADGGNSWVRGQSDIDIAYRPYGQRAVVSNFACQLPHQGVAHQWFTAQEGVIALLPLPGERVSLVWSAPEDLAETLMRESPAQMAARLEHYCAAKLGQLTPLQPEVVKAFPLTLVRPLAITAPRTALVGDAAHVVHPLAGQGMNLGFADVATLLAIIAARETQRDCGDERVLARYARARKEEILLMQIATDGLDRLFSIDFEPLRVARNLGMNLIDKLPFLKRRLLSHALGKRP